MKNAEIFAEQIQELYQRLNHFYTSASGNKTIDYELMPSILKELGTATEELQVAVEHIFEQAEELTQMRTELEQERQQYKNLFELLPNPCIVTDFSGTVQQANYAAAKLLNLSERFLIGKPLSVFINDCDRHNFYFKLIKLKQCDRVQKWIQRLRPRHCKPVQVAVTMTCIRDRQGKEVALHWLLKEIASPVTVPDASENHPRDLWEDRPQHVYPKGEIIPLEPGQISIVRQGLVKLTTINESGSEVLIGLVRASMVFGPCMTALPIFQAKVLSDSVELAYIALSEIADSTEIAEGLLPQMNQRLRQSEALLAISGKRKVKDRLYSLLLLFKEEIGEPVSEGVRLNVRLTHQDLAQACCSTRVTVTRLMGELQEEGKIAYDPTQHIVITT